MTNFRARLAGKRRHEHPIVIHKLQIAARKDEAVAVLKVSMGDAISFEAADETPPLCGEAAKKRSVLQVIFDVVRNDLATDPFHLHNGIGLPVDPNAGALVFESNHSRRHSLLQALA